MTAKGNQWYPMMYFSTTNPEIYPQGLKHSKDVPHSQILIVTHESICGL